MAAILMGVGLGAAAIGQAVSGLSAGAAAKKQAQAQKRAANRYAKALRGQASRMQGGMAAAQKRTLKTDAALDRAALGQQARDEAKRGGQSPSVTLESDLAASMQESMAEQQKMIDQMSNQEAQAKAAQRQALRGQALQTEMQAQAIDPKAIAAATRAPMYGQIATTLGSPLATVGASGLSEKVDFKSKAQAYLKAMSPTSEGGFDMTDDQVVTVGNIRSGTLGSNE